MARLTAGDLKGDTARGARYIADKQAKQRTILARHATSPVRDFDTELREYLAQPVDVLELIRKLDFSEEQFEHAAMEQPALFLDAARLRVQKMRDRARAKIAFETEKAQSRIRVVGTVQEKTDRTTLKKDVRIAERRFEFAQAVEEFTKSLMEAFKERDKAIAIIKDAQWAESGNVVRRIKEKEGRELARRAQMDVRKRYQNVGRGLDDSDD